MKIQYFYKATNTNIPKDVSDDWLIVANDRVYCDNFKSYESQSSTVDLSTFIVEREDIGWTAID